MKHAKLNQNANKVESKNYMITPPPTFFICAEIEGTAPLIQHAFSTKTIEQMLKKHMGIAVNREKKKPRELIEDAKVKNVRGDICVSTTSFKKSMLSAAADIKGLKKTNLNRQVHVVGHGVVIKYRECVPRMDMTRLSGPGRVPDVRFRPMFVDWTGRLLIEYSDQLQVQTVAELLQRGGRSGVGEWRPERGGTFGTFRIKRMIDDPEEHEEVRNDSMIPLVTPMIPSWALDADVDMELIQQVMSEIHDDTRDKRGDSQRSPVGADEESVDGEDEETGT